MRCHNQKLNVAPSIDSGFSKKNLGYVSYLGGTFSDPGFVLYACDIEIDRNTHTLKELLV